MRSQVFFALVAQVAAYTDIVVKQFMYKNIDPIVFPGQYDKSHLHTFFGSDAITINTSTSAELQAGCATAENPNDFSTYCEYCVGTIETHLPSWPVEKQNRKKKKKTRNPC